MKIWLRLIISYLITFAVYNIGGFESSDVLLGIVFFASFMIVGAVTGKNRETAFSYTPGVKKAARTVAFIWTLLYVIYMGGRIDRDLENPLFSGVYILLTVAGLYMILNFAMRFVLSSLLEFGNDMAGKEDAGDAKGFPFKLWLIYTGIILLCMMPLFLLNFPGTMTVDSFDQLNQARGLAAYGDHHPWVHTLIIQAFYSLGYAVTGSVTGGIATYTFIQMLVMAMSVSYAIASLTETGIGRTVRILLLLGFVVYPYNLAYSITMWKDVLFSAAVLVFTVTVYRMYMVKTFAAGKGLGIIRDIVLFVISGLGMCLLRHNGLYAFILTMAVILIYECVMMRKDSEKSRDSKRSLTVLVATIGILIAVVLIRGPIQRAYNVEAGDFAHNIPIPLQQVGRVVYDRCELTDEEWESIKKINTVEFIWEEYTPGGADPMMQWVVFGDGDYLLSHKAEYIALWIKLGLKHPEEYLRAYIDQTRGYYTTMAPEQTEYYGILPNEDGLETKPALGAGIRIKINELCEKLHGMLPVYGILYSMGACFMLLIIGMAVCTLQGKKEKILTYLPVLALTFTLLIATPLCADLRYAYPLMLCMPMFICTTVRR